MCYEDSVSAISELSRKRDLTRVVQVEKVSIAKFADRPKIRYGWIIADIQLVAGSSDELNARKAPFDEQGEAIGLIDSGSLHRMLVEVFVADNLRLIIGMP